MKTKIFLGVLGLAGLSLAIMVFPDLRRYMKIRAM